MAVKGLILSRWSRAEKISDINRKLKAIKRRDHVKVVISMFHPIHGKNVPQEVWINKNQILKPDETVYKGKVVKKGEVNASSNA